MKISRKDQKTLLYVLGVLMIIAVYFLYYSSKQTDLEALQGEVDKLEAEVMELEDYEKNNNEYKKKMQDYYDSIDAMINEFPAEIKEETSIMYGREMETNLGMKVSSIEMTPATLLNTFGVGERQKHLYSSTIKMSATGTYDMVKSMIAGIKEYDDKRTLTSISLTYDNSTANLNVAAVMNLYAIAGKDRIYEKPDTGFVEHGTTNLFGQ